MPGMYLRGEGCLFYLGEVVCRYLIQFHHTGFDERKFLVRPYFGKVKGVPLNFFAWASVITWIFRVHFGKSLPVDCINEVALRVVGVFTANFVGLLDL
jgi:hypothetical protein